MQNNIGEELESFENQSEESNSILLSPPVDVD
jgi:hypothetical protein